mmetsp:Transcript_19/g.59  ORF Transcript_19/g.59 Transcript_19/m.59 type:complete len:896 (+) Transcript_19:246-2933(+)
MEGAVTTTAADADVQQVSAALMSLVCGGAQMSRTLPEGEDMMYFLSVEPQLRPLFEEAKRGCLNLAQKLMDLNAAGTKAGVPRITSAADVDELLSLYPSVVENSTDPLVENVVSYFDHKSGVNALSETTATLAADFVVSQNSRSYRVFHQEVVERPQIHFLNVDNSKAPFVPLLTEKPNSLKPLDECFKAQAPNHANPVEKVALSNDVRSHISSLGLSASTPDATLPNPYAYEIDHFEYVPEQLEARTEIMYKGLENTSFTMVKDLDTLKLVHEKLRRATEIAIDLEQHSFRSYQGFVCLMQISTRTEDFIIDTLALRREVPMLLDVFTDPKIVKVMHGSDSDIVWLQRDFGLYIVNLFDTGQASRVLEYPKNSLAYLLMHFCNVKAKKEYQLADWRIRELPSELVEYARSDTHYLLYIYDRLRKELLQAGNATKNLLLAVLARSRELCKKTYYKTMFHSSKEAIYNRAPGSFSMEQLRVFEALFDWRDQLAREEDESPAYVLPNKLLLHVAELMPETALDLLACCGATASPLLKAHAATVAKLIQDTKAGAAPKMASPVPVKAKAVSILQTGDLQQLQQSQRSGGALPEMNQDQLFQQADWLQSSPANFSTHTRSPRRSAECDPRNVGFNASMVESHIFGAGQKQARSGQQKAARIMDSLTVESLFSFQVEADQFDAKPVEEKAQPVDDPMDVDVVPCSMEEIYQLSNLNRKRNKEKKKLKEDSIKAGPPSPIAFEDDEELDSLAKKDKPAEDTKDFIAKIGWPADFLTESQPESSSDQASHKQRRTHRRTKSISQDANNNSGRRGANGAANSRDKSSRKKRARAHNKTYPPNKSSFDYGDSGTASFNPSAQASHESSGHQSITVPQLGRSSNRARAKGQRSHSYKSGPRGRQN